MEARISLLSRGVEDLERAVSFCRDGLGLPLRDGPDGIAFFETGGTWLARVPASWEVAWNPHFWIG